MADDDAKQEDQAIDVEGGGGDKTKSLVVILIVLSVLVMILTPVITIFTIKAMTPEKASPSDKTPQTQNALIDFKGISANIKETQGSRYVRCDIVIEVPPELKPYFQARTEENKVGMESKIKAKIIDLLSDRTLDGLLSSEARRKLAEQIQVQLNEMLSGKEEGATVRAVYFPTFLVQ